MPRTEKHFNKCAMNAGTKFWIATEVFTRKGLAGTRLAISAEEAHISQGLLYRYFF